MGLKLVSPPAAEPVTLAEAKAHCRVDADITADDDLLTALVVAARERAEHETGRVLVTQTWRQTLPAFPAWELDLWRSPLQSVASVKYIDTDGAEQTLAAGAYRVITDLPLGRLVPAYGGQWPATRATENAVTVEYVAGYGAAADVPRAIRQWMLLTIGAWYASRESLTPGTLVSAPRAFHDALLDPYRILRMA